MNFPENKTLASIFDEVAREDTQGLINKNLLLDTDYAQEQINKKSKPSMDSHITKLSENQP